MSNPPAVSVIMAVFNEADRLPATLESIRQQTFKDYELIVIDDGSSDSTWQILTSVDQPRMRIHRSIPNRGITHSLNYALTLATGKYIARHDAQDVSTPDRFEKQVRYLDSHSKVAAVGAQVDWIDESGAVMRHIEYPTTNANIAKQLESENALPHAAAMIRRSALDAVGGYREAFRLAQDVDLWLRLSKKYQLANLPETLYRMQFTPSMLRITRRAEQEAYTALARQRITEPAKLEQAAEAIRQRFEAANLFARRSQQAKDYLNWAERLLKWGDSSARYVWPLLTQALLAWPFNVDVWQFAFQQLTRSSAQTEKV